MTNLTSFREKIGHRCGSAHEFTARGSQSIKTDIDLSIDKSIKIGKSDQLYRLYRSIGIEIDDRLVSFIDLSRFYRFHRFISENTSVLLFIHTKMKTDFMQTVNLRVEGSNSLL